MSNDEKAMEHVAGWDNDAATRGKVIDSIVLRGDLSGLGPGARARFYIQMCEGLGLNPTAQPFAFLRLNGKEILYVTRGATDQLAAMHRVNRKIIDGPKVIDLAGTKLVYAVCEASLPNGRIETATATVPLTDPVNVLMKAETKAKRRATLSILGLGRLDEMEIETIALGAQEPGGGVDLSRANDPPEEGEAAEEPSGEVPTALGAFYARIGEIELPGEAVAVWMKWRAELAPLPVADRETAWRALCKRTEEVGRMKNAKVWLKKAIAEEDARRGPSVGAQTSKRSDAPVENSREPGDDDDQPNPPTGGAGGGARSSNGASKGSAVSPGPASGPVGLVESWMDSEASVRGYLSQRAHWNALENAVRKHDRAVPARLRAGWRLAAAWRLQTLSLAAVGEVLPLDGDHGCKALVAKWAAEGPRGKADGVATTASQLGMVA